MNLKYRNELQDLERRRKLREAADRADAMVFGGAMVILVLLLIGGVA